MNAMILSVGDELVLGQTVDTNAVWLSQQCAAVGCSVVAHHTVGDDQAMIYAALVQAARSADVILLSGGLGPTEDDLTRQAIAQAISPSATLVLDDEWLGEMGRIFQRIGRPMPETNQIQAKIPQGASKIWNTCGTAAGIRATLRVDGRTAELFAMPGVPKEMKAMFADAALPWLKERSGGAVILSRTLHTFGLGESWVAEKLGTLMTRGRNPSVGTTVSDGIVSLRVNSRFESVERARQELEATCDACRAALGNLIYGQDGQPLSTVVGSMLRSAGKTVATAESCTGGSLAKMLTDIAGSSAYFRFGWVTYANEAKTQQLGVPAEVVARHGAVSEETVKAMSLGAARIAGADFALSLSGIAGPDGGTPEKPVGTVWIALAAGDGVTARRFVFNGDREMIRDRSAKMALTMLRYHLLGQPLPA